MITLELSPYRKARVWLGELPDLGYEVKETVEDVIEVGASAVTGVRRAAIELYLYTGPRDLYGLLGATLTPDRSGRLMLQVAASDDDGKPVDWSLASHIDDVRVGLPRQYAESVFDGAAGTHEIRGLGSGVLRFDRAAHGRVGSASIVFRQIAGSLVRLLAAGAESISVEELERYLQSSAR